MHELYDFSFLPLKNQNQSEKLQNAQAMA